MGDIIPLVQKRKEAFTILADVEAREHHHSVHKMHPLQDQHSLTPTSLAFGNKNVRFENYISGRSKIPSASAKLRNVLQIQIHS